MVSENQLVLAPRLSHSPSSISDLFCFLVVTSKVCPASHSCTEVLSAFHHTPVVPVALTILSQEFIILCVLSPGSGVVPRTFWWQYPLFSVPIRRCHYPDLVEGLTSSQDTPLAFLRPSGLRTLVLGLPFPPQVSSKVPFSLKINSRKLHLNSKLPYLSSPDFLQHFFHEIWMVFLSVNCFY